MVEIYNFAWDDYGFSITNNPLCLNKCNILTKPEKFPAIILYPSLLTPEILVGNQKVELLILIEEEKDLERETVNRHLKVFAGFNTNKIPLNNFELFHDHFNYLLEKITVKHIGNLERDKNYYIDNLDRFGGIICKQIVNLLIDKRFKKIYRVTISNDFPKSQSNSPMKIIGNTQDKIITEVLEKMNSKDDPEWGKYAFRITENAEIIGINKEHPIQSYHPVFYYQNVKNFNFVFFSDIHISPMQQILGKSTARVIEYSNERKRDEDLNVSPEIGPLVNNCLRTFKQLLNQVNKGDIILIGGDIVDYVKACVPAFTLFRLSPDIIWRHVEISENNRHYQDFSSHIAFYSLIIDFYKNHKNPIFIVSGNHDCYLNPYGISPRIGFTRVGISPKWAARANDGIPADHNLTFNEAILIFGPSFHEIVESFTFDHRLLKWFYSVYTPFKDYFAEFPNQIIIGLGWGDSEDIAGTIGDTAGAEFGAKDWFAHLPRSDDAISDDQKKLFEEAKKRGKKKIILFSHFTVISFKSKIPELYNTEVNIDMKVYGGDYDEGTFETNRNWFFDLLSEDRSQLKCILTGHSHRRGIYTIRKDFNRYFAKIYPFSEINIKALQGKPIIIVSDSAGPLPRYNQEGEFSGWGSDAPGGVKVFFDINGDIDKVESIKYPDAKPRIAVVFDYLIHVEEKININTNLIDKRSPLAAELIFTFRDKIDFGLLVIKEVFLYAFNNRQRRWRKISLSDRKIDYKSNQYKFTFRDFDFSAFKEHFVDQKNEDKFFIALKFENNKKFFYNYNDYWVCAFDIDENPIYDGSIYILKPKEIPDFDFYRSEFPHKYRD